MKAKKIIVLIVLMTLSAFGNMVSPTNSSIEPQKDLLKEEGMYSGGRSDDSQSSGATIPKSGDIPPRPPRTPVYDIVFEGGGILVKWNEIGWDSDWEIHFYGVDDKICLANRTEGSNKKNLTCARYDIVSKTFVPADDYGKDYGYATRSPFGAYYSAFPVGLEVIDGKVNIYTTNKLQRNLGTNKSKEYLGILSSLVSYTPKAGQAKSIATLELPNGSSVFQTTFAETSASGNRIGAEIIEQDARKREYGDTVTMSTVLTADSGKVCLELIHSQAAIDGSFRKPCITYNWTR